MSSLTRRDLAWLTPILLIAALLRIPNLGAASFWLDEAYTWYLTMPSWRDVWGVMLLISDTSPLHYVVTRLFVPLIGRSEFALRWLPGMAGVLTIPVTYRLGRAMLGRGAGSWAAALLALSPFAVWYSRDARPYGLYLLLAALALWGLWRWAERRRGPWLFVLSSTALYLTHYASALFAFAQAGWILANYRRHPSLFRRWYGWQALAALPTGLWLLAYFSRTRQITGNGWIPQASPWAPALTLINFLTGAGDRLPPLPVLVGLAAAVVAVAGLRPFDRARRLLVWWSLLPMVSVWLLSLRLNSYVDRFFYPEIISLALLLGAGMGRLVRPASPGRFPGGWSVARWGALVALPAGMLVLSVRLHVDPRYAKEDWRGVAEYIQSEYPDAPVFVQDGETALGLLPYRPDGGVAGLASAEAVQGAKVTTVVALRSLRESNHALSKSALMDPSTDHVLAPWLSAHPERVLASRAFPGVGVVVLSAHR